MSSEDITLCFVLEYLLFFMVQNVHGDCESHTGIDFIEADKYGTVNYFYSPGTTKFPDYVYHDNQHCEWQIRSEDPTRVINLQLTLHNIEEDIGCQLDNVTVFDGPDTSSVQLANLCGENKDITYDSSSKYLFVIFTSNQQHHFKGFTAKYASVEPPNAVNGLYGSLGATVGSIAAGSLIIGAICCCCFKKGMKSRAIKPSTTFRFGNRGLFGNNANPSTTRSINRTRAEQRSSNVQGIFNVRSTTVQFNNPQLQPPAYSPPSYSSLGSNHQTAQQTNQAISRTTVQNQKIDQLPAYTATIAASAKDHGPPSPPPNLTEPPRYSSIAGPTLTASEVKPENAEQSWLVNGNISDPSSRLRSRNLPLNSTAPPSDDSTMWSPPPPYQA